MTSPQRHSSPDEWRWFRHPEKMWALGYVCDAVPGALRDESSFELWEEGGGGVFRVTADSTHPVDPTHLEDLDDVARMNDLHEAPMLALLERRFGAGAIYTWTGDILISVNPYVDIPQLYAIPHLSATLPALSAVPHVFAVAERAYRAMLTEPNPARRNQSLIVSGESGAGKTEACKHIMRFLAVLSQRYHDALERKVRNSATAVASKLLGGFASPAAAAALATSGAGLASPRDEASIERKVLDCNPFLEAFGNAKTARNDNSSRFGKYTCIEYDGGRIAGARLRTFLLEKARVVRPARTERNYHVFYQLVRGASDEERQELLLGEVSDYTILNNETDIAASSVFGVDDSTELMSTRAALSTIGIPPREQHDLFRTLAAILHLGNVTFRRERSDIEDAAVHDVLSADVAGRLLGCTMLGSKLIHRLVRVRGRTSTYEVALTERQAAVARDSLAKSLYERVFGWLVGRTNEKLAARLPPSSFIGILDIFGFEIFERNSFEQLCINFANEKLQALFNHHIFIAEEELYHAEGVDVSHITFASNAQCIELIESKGTGLLPLLDEVCLLARDGTTDNDYLEKIDKLHRGKHPFYEDSRRPTPGKFSVMHFAGRVTYTVEGFIEKNADTLTLDLEEMARASTDPFIAQIFSVGVGETSFNVIGGAGDSTGSGSTGEHVNSSSSSHALSTTISAKFRAQLASLHDAIATTTPHYVRCIKPNSLKRPGLFDRRAVLSQLLYAGVLEAVRIRRQGFPVREDYGAFWRRALSSGYGQLLPGGHSDTLPLPPPNYITGADGIGRDAALTPALIERAKKGVKALLEAVLPVASWRLGRTKVFFAYGATAVLSGALRAAAARRLQSWFRMLRSRLRYRSIRAAIVAVQRKYLYRAMRRKYASAEGALVRIQAHFRRKRAIVRANAIRTVRNTAAAKIGATVLAWRTTAAYRALLRRVRRFQATYLARRTQRIMGTVRKAALTLHAFGRMVPTRAFALRRRVMTSLAAVVIQRVARGAAARRRTFRMQCAVRLIQALMRGRCGRKAVAVRRNAAVVITRGLRRALARRARIVVRNSIVKMQSWWRGAVVRHAYAMRRRSALRVQRAALATIANKSLGRWVSDLHAACACGSAARVDAVLLCKAPEYSIINRIVPISDRANTRNWRDGLRAPLHVAAARPDGDSIVELLLSRGAQDDARDVFLATPVHAAAAAGDSALPALRRLLLRRTAREGDIGALAALSARTRGGETPLDVACKAAAAAPLIHGGAHHFDTTIAFLKEFQLRAANGKNENFSASQPLETVFDVIDESVTSLSSSSSPPSPTPDPALMLLVIAERERNKRRIINEERAERVRREMAVVEAMGYSKRVDIAVAIKADAKLLSPRVKRVSLPSPLPARKESLLDALLVRKPKQPPLPPQALAQPQIRPTILQPLLSTRAGIEREQIRLALKFVSSRPSSSSIALTKRGGGILKLSPPPSAKQRVSPPTKRVIPSPLKSTLLSNERKSAIRAQTLRNNVLNERKSAIQEIQKLNLLNSPKKTVSKSSALSLSPKMNVSAATATAATATTSHVVELPRFSPTRPSLPSPPPLPKPLAPASPIRPVRELVEIYESKTDEIALKMTMLPPRLNPLFDAAALATQPALRKPPSPPQPPQPPPPTEWITIKSSSSGLEYFFNPKTGISQWESPHIIIQNNEAQQAQQVLLRAIDDPREWTVRATREGIPFYECVSAGVVTWARPTALHPLNIIGSAPEVHSFPSSLSQNSHNDFLISQMLGKIS